MKKHLIAAALAAALCLGAGPAFAIGEERSPTVNTHPGYADVRTMASAWVKGASGENSPSPVPFCGTWVEQRGFSLPQLTLPRKPRKLHPVLERLRQWLLRGWYLTAPGFYHRKRGP